MIQMRQQRTWCATLPLLLISCFVLGIPPDPLVSLTPLPSYQQVVPVETGFTIVFVCSGYTADQTLDFQIDVARIVNWLIVAAPQYPQLRTNVLVRYRNFLNLFAIFVPSVNSGISVPSEGIEAANVLHCTYLPSSPSEWRERILCDPQTTLGYAAVSPVDPTQYPLNSAVVALVNTPYYGAGRNGNAVYLSNAYLSDDLFNTTALIMLRLLGQVWFGLYDEYSHGVALTSPGVGASPLSDAPNCADPFTETNIKWSASIYEQQLDPRLASLLRTGPLDTLLQLSVIPESPCTYSDALHPSPSCLMQRSGVATETQRADPAAVPQSTRSALLWDTVPAGSSTLSLFDAVPYYCFVCMQTMAVGFWSTYWTLGSSASLPSGLQDVALTQLPRCPLPNEIIVVGPTDVVRLYTNKYATWANGFETTWELVQPSGATFFLAGNVTALTVNANELVSVTRLALNVVRLTTRDVYLPTMWGADAAAQLDTYSTVSASTDYTVQVVTDLNSISAAVSVCGGPSFDLSSTNGIDAQYYGVCQGSPAACSYNFTFGSLSAAVGYITQISIPLAMALIIVLPVMVAPWWWIIQDYRQRVFRVRDPTLLYMRRPLGTYLRFLRWFTFVIAIYMVVTALSLWVTALKLYLVLQSVSPLVVGITIVLALLADGLAMLCAFGSLMRAWQPFAAVAVLLSSLSITLLATAQDLVAVAMDISSSTFLGTVLQSSWIALVAHDPASACIFEQQYACSGWTLDCVSNPNTVMCPLNCGANTQYRTSCLNAAQGTLTAELSSLTALLLGAGGALLAASILFAASSWGMFRHRTGRTHRLTRQPDTSSYCDGAQEMVAHGDDPATPRPPSPPAAYEVCISEPLRRRHVDPLVLQHPTALESQAAPDGRLGVADGGKGGEPLRHQGDGGWVPQWRTSEADSTRERVTHRELQDGPRPTMKALMTELCAPDPPHRALVKSVRW